MKIPSWWPHENTGEDSLTKRVDQLELQFGNLWEDCTNMLDRIKSLENQNLWNEAPKPESLEDIQAYHESRLKAWLNEGKEDKAEAIRRTIRSVRDENNADKRKKRKK